MFAELPFWWSYADPKHLVRARLLTYISSPSKLDHLPFLSTSHFPLPLPVPLPLVAHNALCFVAHCLY